MILSKTSEYAVRAAACIAIHEGELPVRAKDLVKDIGIPQHYLSKVLRKLVKAEILTATKGYNGGFLLARPSAKIHLLDVLEAVEDKLPVKHCIFGWRACNSKDPCILHERWSSVNDAFQRWARTTTLADIRKDASRSGWLVPFTEHGGRTSKKKGEC